jgi:chromosome segregation ATPase
MTVNERDRNALLRAVEQSWGEEAADTLSELLPADGERPASKRDIEGVLTALNAMDERFEGRLGQSEGRFDRLEGRFDRLEGRFDRLEGRVSGLSGHIVRLDERIAGIEERLEDRFESVVDRITASFERRISDAVITQTRTLVFSQLGLVVAITALAFGLR